MVALAFSPQDMGDRTQAGQLQSLLLLLLLLISPLIAQAQATQTTQDSSPSDPISHLCYPSDYLRTSSACDSASNTRQVQYVKARDCQDPFQLQAIHNEPCDCTPEDYFPTFSSLEANGGQCSITYNPRDCTGGQISSQAVDQIFCEQQSVACQEADIRSIYADCDVVRDPASGAALISEPAVEVIFYYASTCNPNLNGSLPLPPNQFIPCDIKCSPGSYLYHGQCKQCSPGTFSIGGGLRFDSFEEINPDMFNNDCHFKNATGVHSCEGWYVEDGALKVGAFDGPNEWFQDECSVDPAYDCHNDLKAILKMPVRLVRDGHVKFRFTVSAERGFDGLSFFVDSLDSPVMALESYAFHPREVQFQLTEGYHDLIWVYSKDAKWTQGQDSAALQFIEVIGLDFNDRSCLKCPPGYFSAAGASECTPCPMNQFSDKEGAAVCSNCSRETFSLHEPRTNCSLRQVCDVEKDAAAVFSACDAATRTKTKSWQWVQPHICLADDAHDLPPQQTEPCSLCPEGQYGVVRGTERRCEFCPPGTARSNLNSTSDDQCQPCPAGTVAQRTLLPLEHFLDDVSATSPLPSLFHTGCSGDCGTNGWQYNGPSLQSGSGHGKSVSVWLSMNVTMDMDGELFYNFSVDIPPGDMQRGLFFYIDDNLMDDIEDGGYDGASVSPDPMLSGPWELSRGNHTVMWVWVKLNADNSITKTDAAIIHSIAVHGTVNGGASSCERVPEGAEGNADHSSWTYCPAGQFSEGGEANCTNCPANTFNPEPKQGPWGCQECGQGTSSPEGAEECMIGSVTEPTEWCTFTPPIADWQPNATAITFDISPLSRREAGSMFGPVYEDHTAGDRFNGPTYFVSICSDHVSGSTCFDFKGNPLSTYACRVNGQASLLSGKKPAHALGNKVSLFSLRDIDPRLERRGFVMMMEGDNCPFTQTNRITNITFICDPDAGYGEPRAWTARGKEVALLPDLSYPDYISLDGTVLPVGSEQGCQYNMVWYSAYACPMCTEADIELVPVAVCINGKQFAYKYRTPMTCQPNEYQPLPEDVPCLPCTDTDFVRMEDSCEDSEGNHNVTFAWNQPRTCSDEMEGALKLPADIIVGPCVQEILFIPAKYLSPKYIFVFALGGVLIMVLAIVALVTYIKNRRIYNMYAKVVELEQRHELDGDDEDGREVDVVANGAGDDGNISDKVDDVEHKAAAPASRPERPNPYA